MIEWKRLWQHVDAIDWKAFDEKQKKKKGVYVISGTWFDHKEESVCNKGEWAVVIAERTQFGIDIVGCLHAHVKTRAEAKWLQTMHTMGEGITEEERNDPDLARLSRMMPLGEWYKAVLKFREQKAREKERPTKLIMGI